MLKDYGITILYHIGKANVVADALSRKVESMVSLAYIIAMERPFALNVRALTNQFIRLDVLDPSRVLACVVSRYSFYEHIRERKCDYPYLLVLKDTVQHDDAEEVSIEDDRVLRM
ncbi:uncharacterized protein [Nicotiana tomentosiformis]|uniref:uncharacterized protein n=1 Tax=Nicotiana tomentosiformis TaxID=4098 RepID=UPI00388C6689